METRVCTRCKRLFESIGRFDLCPRCLLTYEESYNRVREYLRANPGTALPIVSEETGVSIPIIEKYLRDERIEVAPNSPIMLACKKCGSEIVTGLYCEECSHSVKGELQKIKNMVLADEKTRRDEESEKLRYVPAKWRTK